MHSLVTRRNYFKSSPVFKCFFAKPAETKSGTMEKSNTVLSPFDYLQLELFPDRLPFA